MKELNFEHHNNGYSLIKGFGMTSQGRDTYIPEAFHENILSEEQSPAAIESRMSRLKTDLRYDPDTFYI